MRFSGSYALRKLEKTGYADYRAGKVFEKIKIFSCSFLFATPFYSISYKPNIEGLIKHFKFQLTGPLACDKIVSVKNYRTEDGGKCMFIVYFSAVCVKERGVFFNHVRGFRR
jgi:hypothetical protein